MVQLFVVIHRSLITCGTDITPWTVCSCQVRACVLCGAGLRDYLHWEGTICTSANCLGGQFALVRSVRGDNLHGGTPCTPTRVRKKDCTTPPRNYTPQRARATVGDKERKEKHNYDLKHGEYHNKRVPAVLQVSMQMLHVTVVYSSCILPLSPARFTFL